MKSKEPQPTCYLRVVRSGRGGALEQLWDDGIWRLLQKVEKDGSEIRPAMTQEAVTEMREKTTAGRWHAARFGHVPDAE